MTAVVAPKARHSPRLPWRRLRAFDWLLSAAMGLAILAGLAMIYSATLRLEAASTWEDLVVKQVLFALAGVAVFALVSLTDYRIFVALWVWIYAATVLGLLAILSYGTVFGGAQRWFDLGGIALQPSEFTKIALIVCLAAYFERHDIRRLRHVLTSLGLVALPMFLVLLQPNLSTALLLGVIWAGVAFAAGMRAVHGGLLALLIGPVLLIGLRSGLVQDYMLDRIRYFLNPGADAADKGYQAIQTLIAVGNGGLLGRGYASGMQSQGGWLPLMYTDSIFALVAEELGYLGGLAFLALLAFIVARVLRAAALAQDPAGSLIAAGVAAYLLSQTFINIAVVLQLMPVTGLSLPLISYGGSSLLAICLALGLVQSVLLRRKPLEFTG